MSKISRPNRNRYKEKPDYHTCNKCNISKPFTNEFFHKHSSKFNLSYVCKLCEKDRKAKNDSVNKQQVQDRRKKWKNKNLITGKCSKCAQLRIDSSNIYCEKHWFQDLSYKHLGTKVLWKELQQLLENQNFTCYYSGLPLKIGVNASVDHINPISKFPELKNNLNNLVWADIRINRMKREHSIQEFLELCSLVVQNNKSTPA